MEGQDIQLCWVPEHREIKGNDKADAAVKEAAKDIPLLFALPNTDYYPASREVINRQWQDRGHIVGIN